jgi:ATP synthase protein I
MADERTDFAREVAAKASRSLRARRMGNQTAWFGLGMSGIIGWSVAVPTALGGILGAWWDHRHPGPHSWTLALLAAGLVLGCVTAWHWVSRQSEDMGAAPDE